MKKENNEYLNLMPEQDTSENLETDSEDSQGFETSFEFGDVSSNLEGIPTMNLEIGSTDF